MSRDADPVLGLIRTADAALDAMRQADAEDASEERMWALALHLIDADNAVRGQTPATLPGLLAKLRHAVRRAPSSPSVHALRDAIAWLEKGRRDARSAAGTPVVGRRP